MALNGHLSTARLVFLFSVLKRICFKSKILILRNCCDPGGGAGGGGCLHCIG